MHTKTTNGRCVCRTIGRRLRFAVLCLWAAATIATAQDVSETPLDFAASSAFQLSHDASQENEHHFITQGPDPQVRTVPLADQLPADHVVLEFEYFCPEGLDHLQVFFGPPVSEQRSIRTGNAGVAEAWVPFALDLSDAIEDWGRPGDFLRLDFGGRKDVDLRIRKIRLRPFTERERQLAAAREQKQDSDRAFHQRLDNYLGADFESHVDRVVVGEASVRITGRVAQGGTVYLAEVPPHLDVSAAAFAELLELGRGDFDLRRERFVEREGFRYDRLLSKWALVEDTDGGPRLRAHARYADEIPARHNLPDEKPATRKGLGGFSASRGHLEDLKDLGITSATVNIAFTGFMFSQPADGRIAHDYNGTTYYFGEGAVQRLDETLRTAAAQNIVVAAILLVGKASQCPDPEIGRLMQHPDMDPSGTYAMPNMTTPESVDCYAAALDFLARRYSRPDKQYGRIHHFIMHNEVDAGWVWTNMGEQTDLVYMDAYVKSMRLCYNIARSYNPHAQVFISLTHYWAWTSHPKFYPAKNLMEILLKYGRAEGDFRWGLAHHPYPESLREPKTWLDKKAEFTFDTPLITFRNLEVLDAWIKRPEVLYQGTQKRTLWLSENGTNSPSYSEQDLREQAAGFAYTWKKMQHLDGIDAFQWHNWIDNRGEGGLRIGLRRYPDDADDPGGRKPVWYVYQAAGTPEEDAVFAPYKEVIGIDDWDEVRHSGEID